MLSSPRRANLVVNFTSRRKTRRPSGGGTRPVPAPAAGCSKEDYFPCTAFVFLFVCTCTHTHVSKKSFLRQQLQAHTLTRYYAVTTIKSTCRVCVCVTLQSSTAEASYTTTTTTGSVCSSNGIPGRRAWECFRAIMKHNFTPSARPDFWQQQRDALLERRPYKHMRDACVTFFAVTWQ